MGIAILYLFPYVMKYSFKLNDSIIDEASKTFNNNNSYSEIIGSYIGAVSDIQYDHAFEERSPEYVTRADYIYSVGSVEATLKYFEQLEKYQSRGDIMRIMRAMAGITGKFIYVILWFIMLWQMVMLLYVYLKRYLMIAFLIMVFPIVVIEYIIGTVFSGKSKGFSGWCMEFFLNVFLQTIHAITYGIIGGVVMNHIHQGIQDSMIYEGYIGNTNWVLLIIAVNFIFEAENIIKKIIKANAESIRNTGEISKGVSSKIKSKLHLG